MNTDFETVDMYALFSDMQLSSFPAVDEEESPPHLYHLRGRIMLRSGQSTSAAEYIHFKDIHHSPVSSSS